MPRKSKSDSALQFRNYISQPGTHTELKKCRYESPDNAQLRITIMSNAPLYGCFDSTRKWTDFINAGLTVSEGDSYWQSFFKELKTKAGSLQGSHQEKRALVHDLKLGTRMGSVLACIQEKDFSGASAWLKSTHNIDLVLRNRHFPIRHRDRFPDQVYHKYLNGYRLAERENQDLGEKIYICSAKTGFLVIPPTQSVIIVSQDKAGEYQVELVVLRGILSAAAARIPLTTWLRDVIYRACTHRRDVRPNHPGKMAQVGLNMGQRNARILGWAKSFTANLSDDEKTIEDTDILGAMSLFWGIVKACIPEDIVGPVQELLDSGYPSMATRNIPQGSGFTLNYDGSRYTFTDAGRAPPEGYATLNYEAPTHTDPTHEIKWSFGWTIGRMTSDGKEYPAEGGNLADLGLRVLVRNAPGTLTAFQPDSLHGTTDRKGVTTHGLSLTFSRRVGCAYKELAEKGGCVEDFTDI